MKKRNGLEIVQQADGSYLVIGNLPNGTNVRKRVPAKATDKIAAGEAIIAELMLPFKDAPTVRAAKNPLMPLLRRALRNITDVRATTVANYNSKLKGFDKWLTDRKMQHIEAHLFTPKHAAMFMATLNDMSGTTYNNYRDLLTTLFEQLVKADIVSVNPFKAIERREEHPETYEHFSPSQRSHLWGVMAEENPTLWLAVHFIYYGYIRPGELRLMRVGDLRPDEQSIRVQGYISKNKDTAVVAMPEPLRGVVELMGIMSYPPHYYILGADGVPTEKPIGKNWLKNHHQKILKGLGYDTERYKLYSWKHTGAIRAAEAGIPAIDLKNQLRHGDLNTTEKYLRRHSAVDSDRLKRGDW